MLKREKSALYIEENERCQEQVALKEKTFQFGFINQQLKKNQIGIENSLQGKVLFITGGTGFFGKVLIEKILRSMSNVSKIYLMIRGKDQEVVKQRLKNEIVDLELFKCLKQRYGEHYEAFMWNKLVAVVGNMTDPNDLGMEQDLAIEIAKHVQIIVNSSGDTTFDLRYDTAIQINAMGPCNILAFAKKCKNLELFVHISSVSVKRRSKEGRFMEEKLRRRDKKENETFKSEIMVLETEMKLASAYKKIFKDNVVAKKLRELGLNRAKQYGWPNTYGFTKALGEMLIDKMKGEIPVVILRPSGISSTYKEPFPGWIEGNKVVDPLIMNHGKGKLTGFLANPNCVLTIIPADIAVNTTLAAMAKHVLMSKKAEVNIYHICSSTSNPFFWGDLFTFSFQHFGSSPFIHSNGRPIQVSEMRFFNSMQDYSNHLQNQFALPLATTSDFDIDLKQLLKIIKFKELAERFGTIYSPYTFQNYWSDDSNVQGLIKSMSEEEKKKFECNVKTVDWKDYIINVHIPGLRRHVWKEKALCKM